MRISMPLVCLAATLAGPALASPALAASQRDWDQCKDVNNEQKADQNLAACDRILKDPKTTALDRSSAYSNRCGLWSTKGQSDRALTDCNEAIRLDPKSNNALDNRANAYSDKGDHDRAVRDYNESLRLNPKNPITLANRCDELGMLGQYQAALVDCNESLKIRPDHLNTLLHRALVHVALDNRDEALADYANVLRQNPKRAEALYGRGMVKLRKGDVSGGNEDMASAKAIDKDVADDLARYGPKTPKP
jgi:tetratricopeptide (TPR) repeat protein